MENDLLEAAMAWWESKRPDGWTAERHLGEPLFGCTTEAEEKLARICADWKSAGLAAKAYLAGRGRRRASTKSRRRSC